MSKNEPEVRMFDLKQIRSGWSKQINKGHPSELDDKIKKIEEELNKYN